MVDGADDNRHFREQARTVLLATAARLERNGWKRSAAEPGAGHTLLEALDLVVDELPHVDLGVWDGVLVLLARLVAPLAAAFGSAELVLADWAGRRYDHGEVIARLHQAAAQA